jgi:hypothetical protein
MKGGFSFGGGMGQLRALKRRAAMKHPGVCIYLGADAWQILYASYRSSS